MSRRHSTFVAAVLQGLPGEQALSAMGRGVPGIVEVSAQFRPPQQGVVSASGRRVAACCGWRLGSGTRAAPGGDARAAIAC